MDVEARISVDGINEFCGQRVAGIAAVGVAHHDDGAFIIGCLDGGHELLKLRYSGGIVGIGGLSVHVERVDIDRKSLTEVYHIVAVALEDKLVGAVAGVAVGGVPGYKSLVGERVNLLAEEPEAVGVDLEFAIVHRGVAQSVDLVAECTGIVIG